MFYRKRAVSYKIKKSLLYLYRRDVISARFHPCSVSIFCHCNSFDDNGVSRTGLGSLRGSFPFLCDKMFQRLGICRFPSLSVITHEMYSSHQRFYFFVFVILILSFHFVNRSVHFFSDNIFVQYLFYRVCGSGSPCHFSYENRNQ